MSGITLETAKKHLDMWLEAEAAVANGQSYSIGSRTLTRANLSEIRSTIDYWNNKVAELENISNNRGRNRIIRAVPRDL